MKKYLALILCSILSVCLITGCDDNKSKGKKWKIEITYKYVNVRKDHDPYSEKIAKAYKGERYEVVDIYLEDEKYVWYKINYKGKERWIASDRNDPYVKEYNNPNSKDEKAYFIDYKKPVVKFYEDTYNVNDINSITYDHLTIEDDSDYVVTHEVFFEKESKDEHVPQYWIRYTVTDAFGNKTSKTQKIVFKNKPKANEVKDFDTEY